MRRLLALVHRLAFLLSVLPLVLLPLGPAAAADIGLAPGTEFVSFADEPLFLLRDPSAALGIEDAIRLDREGRFVPHVGNPALGYSGDALWLAANIVRKPGSDADWLLEVQPSYLDEVQLYVRGANGFERQEAGDRLPLSQRGNHHTALFRLSLPEGETRLYLRVRTSSSLAVVPRLWTPRAFAANLQPALLSYGVYFGLMLAVVLFNLVNGIITGRRICYLYSAYALSSTLIWWSADGFLGQFWLPESPTLVNQLLPVSIAVNALLAAAFYYVMFGIRDFPNVRRFYLAFSLVALATLFSVFADRYQQFAPWMYLCALAWIPLTFVPAWRAWHSGRADARFAALAFMSFAVLVGINMLTLLGVFAAGMGTLVWSGQVSNLTHILLLHVSIILGLRQADEDKNAADILAVEARRDAWREREDNAEKGRFLSMITHEIRTPISVIAAASESLRILDTDTSPQRIDRYEKIARAVQRMTHLLDILLNRDATGADALSANTLNLTPVDLTSLTQEIIAQHPEGRQRLYVTAPPILPLALADSRHLRFAFINLIDNALKYSTPDTPIDIHIAAHAEEGLPLEVEWRISNIGESIPASERERIFDKHARLSETAGKPGLGLGLYLARHIVHQHGGRLFVDPWFVAGAAFVIWLPSTSGDA